MPDNLLGGLELLIVAMVVVFLVLWVIIAFVKAFKLVIRKPGDEETVPPEVSAVESNALEVEPDTMRRPAEPEKPGTDQGEVIESVTDSENGQVPVQTSADGELIAVLTAAVSAYQGEAPFVVKSVHKLPEAIFDPWQLAGRQRLIDSRRMKLPRR